MGVQVPLRAKYKLLLINNL